MAKNITYKWGIDSLTIELGNRAETRMKVLFWAEFLFTAGLASLLLVKAIPFTSFFNVIVSFCASALYTVAFYRFLVRLFSKEEIVLDEFDIVLIRRHFLATRHRHFSWNGISPLFYVGQAKRTPHPLKGDGFGFLGFQSHEHMIQKLNHQGNLYFYYGGHPIHFARNIYAWNAEEMIGMMKLFAGNKLRLAPQLQVIIKSENVGNEGMGFGIQN